MKIVFNGINSGLANNGGSRTILLSSQVLESLGHKCNVVSSKDNFTWFDHKAPIPSIPWDTEVVINIAAVDYMDTKGCNVPVKAAWWRAHEDWSMNEEDLIKLYNSGLLNIVNSRGLQEKLKSYGADSVVVYQGIDFDWWGDRNLLPTNKMRIGALHTVQPRKRWKDFVELSNILGHDHYEYVGIGNAVPKDMFLTEFIHNANVDELNDLYSSCHVWFAPTESEGLHNVPMEAALCGCLVVCSDNVLNGMVLDYAFDGDTAIVYPFGDIEYAADAIERCDWAMEHMIPNMQTVLKDNIGSREKNMENLISIFKEMI